ncbi:class I SAM-dependent methyltransferase [Desulfoprunum benzoelyticum]|uniref:class I SAM-dependent methyltransferase n=1 Tax=Desulfoprunum benzoelyticum TaxID=1506996 RepID=UPI00196249CC|nr:class I SAM-dependent methyltransferase [Desulfoprunum benzoelyticum]
MPALDRKPHAVLDLPSRQHKALKIERLLDLSARSKVIRLLEIGTGSGGIAHYFATHRSIRCDVAAVDVVDQRLLRDKYMFVLIKDTVLPFANGSFDVVISNHVIEHVGNRDAQSHHISEIHRVLKMDGIGYLAVPNRWMLIEPHYKLIFLSWLPLYLRSYYLRLARRGIFYDCEPLEKKELEKILDKNGFAYRNICTRAFRETLAIEKKHGLLSPMIKQIPDCWLDWLSPIIPTLIYRLQK